MRVRAQRLPVGYRELEYIESDGNQYIDTGYLPNFNTRIVCNAMLTTMTNGIMLFGAIGSEPELLEYSSYIAAGQTRPCFRAGSSASYTFYSSLIDTYKSIEMDWNVTPSNQRIDITIGGDEYTYNKTYNLVTSNEFDHNLFLFASSQRNGQAGWKGAFRLYKMIIYNTGARIRNFIPAERALDGKPGLYDIINGVFYTNQGTGEFIQGPYKDSYRIPAPYKIPDGYLELEYIQSTGTQYIDTGLFPHNVGRWQLDVQYTSTGTQLNGVYGLINERFDIGQEANGWLLDIGSLRTFGSVDLNRHLFELDNIKGKVKIDDISYDSPIVNFSTQTTYPILIGLRRYYADPNNLPYCYEKIYLSKIYNKTNGLIRNFVPALRKSDNEIGLLDIANNVFYTNQGTGTFIAGPVKTLPSEYQQVEYIESSGAQCINTGLSVNYNFKIDASFCQMTDVAQYQQLFGIRGYGAQIGLYIRREGSDDNVYYDYVNRSSAQKYYNVFSIGDIHHVVVDKHQVYVDGNLAFSVDAQSFGYTTNSLYLFAYNNSSGSRDFTYMRLFSCKMYDDGKLARDFIPCYRKSDNVIGLYDLVGRQFYTNQGAGKFIKGNDVGNIISRSPIVPTYGYNQKISNSDFSQGSYDWCYNNNAGTYSIENNVLTFTRTGGDYAYDILYKSYAQLTLTANHKYLLSLKMCASAPCKIRFYTFTGSADFDLTTTMTQYQAIGTVVDRYFTFTNVTGGPAIGDRISFKDINFFDLTDWFGVGKEPTVSSEFRQKFSKDNYGYCPTPIRLTERQINALPLYGYNQLEYVANTTTTTNGITINRDSSTGVYTLNGTSTVSGMTFLVIGTKGYNNTTATRSGHKMLLLYEYLGGTISGDSNAIFLSYSGGALGDNNIRSTYQQFTAKIVTHSSTMSMGTFGTYIYANRKYDNWKFRLSTIDLTDWFGEGNEPTIDQFRSVFPYTYYGYCFDSKLNRYQINALAAK